MAKGWCASGLVVVAAWLYTGNPHPVRAPHQDGLQDLGRHAGGVSGEVSQQGRHGLALASRGGSVQSPGETGEGDGSNPVDVQTERQAESDMTRDETIELTRQSARDHRIPERVGLGLIWAESNFEPLAYRHTSPEDHSVGLGQQTFRWSEFWHGSYDDPQALAEWWMAYVNPYYALAHAFTQMQHLRVDDHLEWLCRYNKRSGQVAPSVRRRYQDGLNWADEYLRTHQGDTIMEHEFSGGFADLALRLEENGKDPGEPLTGEEQWGSATVQVTTTGLMIWVSGGQPLFLAGIGTQG
jgi:hypothetical protein